MLVILPLILPSLKNLLERRQVDGTRSEQSDS